MTLTELIGLLKEDLRREVTHMHFYMRAAATVKGMCRNHFSDFFKKSAESEMNHASEFCNLIAGLGVDDFGLCPFKFPSSSDAKELLEIAKNLEQEVVDNYYQRIQQAESLNSSDGKWVAIFLESQLEDSRNDLSNIVRMLQ